MFHFSEYKAEMPEETKMAVDNDTQSKNKSTTNVRSSGNTLAQVTMLDGSVLNINIDVSVIYAYIYTCFILY